MKLLAYLRILRATRLSNTLFIPLDLSQKIADAVAHEPNLLSRTFKVFLHAMNFAARRCLTGRQIRDFAFLAVDLADCAAHWIAVAFHAFYLATYNVSWLGDKTRAEGLPCTDHTLGLFESYSSPGRG